GDAAGRTGVLIDLVGAVVHDPDVADVVGIDRDAGGLRVGRVDGPATLQRAGQRVLEDHVGGAIHDPERGAVGHDVLRIAVAAVTVDGEVEAAGRTLAAGEAAGRARVLVDLIGGAIDQPDVGAVGGDACQRRGGTQAAGRPGALQRTAGAVNVDILVG